MALSPCFHHSLFASSQVRAWMPDSIHVQLDAQISDSLTCLEFQTQIFIPIVILLSR